LGLKQKNTPFRTSATVRVRTKLHSCNTAALETLTRLHSLPGLTWKCLDSKSLKLLSATLLSLRDHPVLTCRQISLENWENHFLKAEKVECGFTKNAVKSRGRLISNCIAPKLINIFKKIHQ
jgi:hypothetical protein